MKLTEEELERQKRLGVEVQDQLTRHGRSQAWLADQMAHELGSPVSQSLVSQWLTGAVGMSPAKVFALERVLKLRAGSLATLLGYVPTTATRSFEETISTDASLTMEQRETLIDLYRTMVTRATRSRS